MSDFYDQENEPCGDKKYDDFYLKLRRAVQSGAQRAAAGELTEYLLCVPDFFYLLVKLSTDPRVPAGNKAQIIAALAYYLSPLDVIPDFIPGLGWLDDLYLSMIVVDNLMNSVEPGIIEEYWPGDQDLVRFIKVALDKLNEKLGAGAVRRILSSIMGGEDKRG